MRVSKVQIDGFGALRERIYELRGPVTILYGPNEAGKSTFMNFVRYVLFGYPSRGGFVRYGEDGAVHGGALSLSDEAGRTWRVERYEGRSGSRGRSGEVRVTLDDGTSGGEALLSARLGGISGDLYRSLYAFGLGELQELRTLQAEEVAAFLYGAGFGGGGAVIRETERRLQLRMDELYRPRGRNQPVAQTLKALEDMDAALRRSRGDASRYEERRNQLAALDDALAQLAAQSRGMRERADWLGLCMKARPQWLALRALEREWAETPAFPTFPEAGVSRWETLAAEREALLAEQERLVLRRSRAAERLEALGPAAAENAGREKLLQLLESVPLFEQAGRDALQLEGERRQLSQRLTGLLRAIDAAWDEETLRSVPVTVALREHVRGCRERLAALAQEGERLQAELVQAKQRAEDAAEELRLADSEADATQRQAAMRYPWPPDAEPAGDDDPARLVVAIRRDYGEWQRLEAEAAHVCERRDDERRHREQLRQAAASELRGTRAGAYAVPAAVLALGLLLGAWLFAAGERPAAAVAAAALAALALLLPLHQQRQQRPRPARRGRGVASSVPADEEGQYGERLSALAAQQQLLQHRLQERVGRLTAAPYSAAASEPPVSGAADGAAMHFAAGSSSRASAAAGDGAAMHFAAARSSSGASAGAGEGAARHFAAVRSSNGASAGAGEGAARHFAAARSSSGASAAGEAAAWEATRAWLDGALDDWERLVAGWQREREAVRRRLERLAELQHASVRARELQLQAARRLEALSARREPELAAWQAWLREQRLPANMSPDAALEALQIIEQGHAYLAQIDALEAKVEALRGEREAFENGVSTLLQLLPGETAPAALRRWKEADDRALIAQAERDRLLTELSGLADEAEALELRLRRADERAIELLAAAHAADEQELRANARCFERRIELQEERRSLFAALEAWIGDNPLERLDTEWYGKDVEAAERELHSLQSELERLEQEEQELRDRRGRLAGELERLESGSDHADRLQRRQELIAQLQRQAEEWTELAMAAALFKRTRELFEREKQPQVLQRASAYFANMTEGRYSRIVAPLGEQKLLAMRPDGETVDPGKLSRGTAEQLYLAMRFAIAAEAEQIRSLPILLDDILVNFDETRAGQSMRLIGEMAQTRHILLFTCHAHIVRMAEKLLPDYERIDL